MYDEKVGNNMLLWHGSRLSNFVGILSQGLRIAPPEAPVSGYLFGKGIYLADMAEKSIHYCRSYGSDTALILLIEVHFILIQGAIGNPNVLLQSAYNAKELMEQNKKNSTKCHGSKAPPESSYVKLKNMVIPKGKPVPTGSGSYMGHNEFIVYNMNQARIRYVLRMDMKGQ